MTTTTAERCQIRWHDGAACDLDAGHEDTERCWNKAQNRKWGKAHLTKEKDR